MKLFVRGVAMLGCLLAAPASATPLRLQINDPSQGIQVIATLLSPTDCDSMMANDQTRTAFQATRSRIKREIEMQLGQRVTLYTLTLRAVINQPVQLFRLNHQVSVNRDSLFDIVVRRGRRATWRELKVDPSRLEHEAAWTIRRQFRTVTNKDETVFVPLPDVGFKSDDKYFADVRGKWYPFVP